MIALSEILTSDFLQSHLLWRPCIDRILIFICTLASGRDGAALDLCPGTCIIESTLYTMTRMIENRGLASLDTIEWCWCTPTFLHMICVSLWPVIYTSPARIHNFAVMIVIVRFYLNIPPSIITEHLRHSVARQTNIARYTHITHVPLALVRKLPAPWELVRLTALHSHCWKPQLPSSTLEPRRHRLFQPPWDYKDLVNVFWRALQDCRHRSNLVLR